VTLWVHEKDGVTIGVDRGALASALNVYAPAVNEVAESLADEVRSILPHPTMRAFVSVKHAGVVETRNVGRWPLKLAGRRYGGRGNQLMRGVVVPVALVLNLSRLAMTWEYGSTAPKPSTIFNTTKARTRKKKAAGEAAVYGPEYYRRYQPFTLAAQRVKARPVLKHRAYR